MLAIRNMGGESEAAWRAVLDDLTSRGLARPDLVIAMALQAPTSRTWRSSGELDQLYLAWPFFGSRRRAEGYRINRERVRV